MENQEKRRAIRTGKLSLSFEQVKKLLSCVSNVRDEALLVLALDLGARREDVVSITLQDVDFENSLISYHQNKKGYRHSAYIEPRTSIVLQKYLSTRQDKKKWLFPTNSSKRLNHITGRQAYNIYRKYLILSGILDEKETKPFHSLRSTCIKLKLLSGWTPPQVAEHIDDTLRVIELSYITPTYEEMKNLSQHKPALNF